MKTTLLAAVAVAALSLGVSAVRAAPLTQLNDTATSAEATNIEPAGVKFHFGFYGGYPYGGYPYGSYGYNPYPVYPIYPTCHYNAWGYKVCY